jgi:biotin transport system substrate-specific component
MSTVTESLAARAFEGVDADQRARYSLGAVVFAVAAAFSAQVAVPLPWTPVPVTLQPLMVILAGVVLGGRLGAISMLAYVTAGALGAPIFSNGGMGLAWLMGPTGGYLLAAPAAAWVAGVVAGRDRGAPFLALGLTLGVATMYAGGVMQLMAVTGMNLSGAVAAGMTPFIVGDLTKIGFAFFGVHAARTARRAKR